MSGIQRHFLQSIVKFLHQPRRYFSRSILNMSVDDQKNTKTDNKSDKITTEDLSDNETKISQFNNYDGLLPHQKGDINVCIIGGGVESIYTATLLKQCRLIKRVHLIDPTDSMSGAVLDASHIDTSTRIKYFKKEKMREGLKGMNIIALMDETDAKTRNTDPKAQFKVASNYVREMTEQLIRCNPISILAVFVRPVTATLAMISEIYKCAGWWNPDRIIGSTAHDCMRMETITANLLDQNPAFLSVPMIGGADSNTIVPLFSRARPVNRFTDEQQNTLLQSLRGADREMENMQFRGPCLSAGAAAAKLICTLAGAVNGFENVVACAFVRSNVLPICRFFTSELQFGVAGVQRSFGLPKISSSEVLLIEQAIPFINEYVEMGINAVRSDVGAQLNSLSTYQSR